MAAEKGKKSAAVRESFTKAQLFAAISEETGLPKKDVANVFASLTDIVQRHLKSRGPGIFTLPGIVKFTVAKKKATKARKGINPFNSEEIMIPAKPARRVVKVRALKGLKAMADA